MSERERDSIQGPCPIPVPPPTPEEQAEFERFMNATTARQQRKLQAQLEALAAEVPIFRAALRLDKALGKALSTARAWFGWALFLTRGR